MQMIAATNNEHKLKELRKILENLDIQLVSLKDINLDIDIEETGSTFEENALIKAREIFKITGRPTIADDSGLEVKALGGEPGVRSARYSGSEGKDKDKDNRLKLINEMKSIPKEDRGSRFCCAIVAVFPGGEEIIAKGYLYGSIAFEESGSYGFGYDSLFIPEGAEKTLAHYTDDEKNSISHRANALKEFKKLVADIL